MFNFINICFSSAQTNMVPNFSFEDTTGCPMWSGQIYYTPPWNSIMPCGGSDYFNSCSNGNSFGVPQNCGGYELAHSGNAYAGVVTFITQVSYRDYLQIHLTDSLKPNFKYYIEFYVSLADSLYYACNSMGAYFSYDSITGTLCNPLPYIPQINNPTSNLLTNKNGWTKISGRFTANGGEKYLIIGNFNDDANSDTMYVGGAPSSTVDWRYAYYYIDDVTVICDTMDGLNEIENNYTFRIFPNPAKEEFNIELLGQNKNFGNIKFELYGSLGKKLISVNLDNFITTISAKELSNGVYYCRIIINNNAINDKLIMLK